LLATSPILAPIVALAVWTHVIWAWMYATRIPAILAARMPMDPDAPRGQQMALLPSKVRWKADNYNHLMEQPTLFYAVALCLALLGQGYGASLTLAWAYVALRVVHSLVQVIVNKIEVRFGLFMLSSLVLIGLTVNAVLAVL
jgi:hypothetical protein